MNLSGLYFIQQLIESITATIFSTGNAFICYDLAQFKALIKTIGFDAFPGTGLLSLLAFDFGRIG